MNEEQAKELAKFLFKGMVRKAPLIWSDEELNKHLTIYSVYDDS